MKLSPDRPDAFFQAARLLAATGATEEAKRTLVQAIRLGGATVKAAAAHDPLLRKAGIDPGKL